MRRRVFLGMAAALPALATYKDIPSYRTVSSFQRNGTSGMPGKHHGTVVKVHSDRAIDAASGSIDSGVVQDMLSHGMVSLTGKDNASDAWASFFEPHDVIGIKVNCSGAPKIMSRPEVVKGVVANLLAVGVPPRNIFIYERFLDQLASVRYDQVVPEGVNIVAIETERGSILGYDPHTYVEVDFFGEDDTRSNLVRLVPERFTKIINIPNMKDHGAAGVTGCLKNIAYGNFSNVARSHYREKTNTLSFIGTLASTEPLRSKTVLHVMDGLRGIWHGGPFYKDDRFCFYPKQIWFGTDPVAMDRLLIDVIEDKRKSENAISVWERSMQYVKVEDDLNPNVNHFIREPGHIEYAGYLGLGLYDKDRIQVRKIDL
jgi:uncharacterized protein (DUF362 family)